MKDICRQCNNHLCIVREKIEEFREQEFFERDRDYYKEELANELRDYDVELDVNGDIKVIRCLRDEKRI